MDKSLALGSPEEPAKSLFPPLSLLSPGCLPDPRQGLGELAESGTGMGGEGAGLAGTHGAPRAPSPQPPRSRPAARLGAGRGRGRRAAAGAAQHGHPRACEPAERRAAPAPLRWAAQAGPPCRSPLQAARAAPRRARRLWPCATEAPPPPRLSACPSPPGPSRVASDSGLGACGPRPQPPRPGWLLTSRRRNPEEEEEEGGKKRHEGGRGKTLLLFLLQAPKRGAGDCDSARFRESSRRHLRLPRRTGGPTARPGCGTRRSSNATGRPSSPGRRLRS